MGRGRNRTSRVGSSVICEFDYYDTGRGIVAQLDDMIRPQPIGFDAKVGWPALEFVGMVDLDDLGERGVEVWSPVWSMDEYVRATNQTIAMPSRENDTPISIEEVLAVLDERFPAPSWAEAIADGATLWVAVAVGTQWGTTIAKQYRYRTVAFLKLTTPIVRDNAVIAALGEEIADPAAGGAPTPFWSLVGPGGLLACRDDARDPLPDLDDEPFRWTALTGAWRLARLTVDHKAPARRQAARKGRDAAQKTVSERDRRSYDLRKAAARLGGALASRARYYMPGIATVNDIGYYASNDAPDHGALNLAFTNYMAAFDDEAAIYRIPEFVETLDAYLAVPKKDWERSTWAPPFWLKRMLKAAEPARRAAIAREEKAAAAAAKRRSKDKSAKPLPIPRTPPPRYGPRRTNSLPGGQAYCRDCRHEGTMRQFKAPPRRQRLRKLTNYWELSEAYECPRCRSTTVDVSDYPGPIRYHNDYPVCGVEDLINPDNPAVQAAAIAADLRKAAEAAPGAIADDLAAAAVALDEIAGEVVA